MCKIFGCVILYNPPKEVLDNIASYIYRLDKLFVVDNANGGNVIKQLKERYGDKIEAIVYAENQGIAKPLNDVLRKCVLGGGNYLLTMDQDSRFVNECFGRYCDEVEHFNWDKVLMLGACIVNDAKQGENGSVILWNKVLRTITSGSIVDVKKAIEIGGFDEDLFIDEVDHEFCYRGYVKRKYEVYTATGGIYLLHHLGNMVYKFILYRHFGAMNHGYVRKYYVTRNRLYVYKKYHWLNEKFFLSAYVKAILRMYFSVFFIEGEDNWRKFKYMCIGIRDFFVGRKGKVY